LRLAPRPRLVQLLGPRLERVDLPSCGRRGVYVANVPWGSRSGEPGFARLVEGGEPSAELAESTLARIATGNIRRLLRGQAPLFWVNPPAWLDAEQALCGRTVVAEPRSAWDESAALRSPVRDGARLAQTRHDPAMAWPDAADCRGSLSAR
jgi:hypothetical protein